MKTVQVYGSGCKNCQVTAERLTQVAQELGLAITIEKVTSLESIMQAGIMSTPGVAIEGTVIHSGSVPSLDLVHQLLSENAVV
ncbi:thioredoxin family protein [Vibrio fluminensis]|uniref:thioredoxin family protein n=1 Tax=Vibrio fluminensis TaxID=2783614 RepID=UPI0018870969|nr:thioredoxin family protein [Vibrio fluminensis]